MEVKDKSLEVYDWIEKLSKNDIEKYVDYICSITGAEKDKYQGIFMNEPIIDKIIEQFPETQKMSRVKAFYYYGLHEIVTIFRMLREGSKKSIKQLALDLKVDNIKRDKILFKYLKNEGRKEAKNWNSYYNRKKEIYKSNMKEKERFIPKH
ncbi:MAG: hypothetical protein JW791_02255 [Nanoarchaeota archaeon]|nr:hypothetical protein [Nanoarchaeota archaeon]